MLPINDKDFKVELTGAAFDQIKLILDSDFTLKNHFFRLKIGGKGCDGFTYETGFSKFEKGDKEVFYFDNFKILVDPFTYYYCKEGLLDYVLDSKRNEDGFTFTNSNENIYSGKFFKEETLVPNKEDLI